MNSRYLFKAKRKNWKELPKEIWWVHGYYVKYQPHANDEEPVHGIIPDGVRELYVIEIDKSTICRCTGLKDKNGTLIWENDAVNCIESECCGKIVWNENEAGFYFNALLEDGTYEEEHVYDYVDCMEVIGNIFDNPELLK